MADRNMVMSLLPVIIDDIMDIEEELSIMDEEEIEELVLVNVGSTNRRIIPNVIGFAEEVIPQYTETDFRRDFRVCKNTFERLIAELTPAIEYTIRESGKEGLPVRKQLLVYLWYISNQDSIREISRLFVCQHQPSTDVFDEFQKHCAACASISLGGQILAPKA
ncbi:uncharacterized protein LOC117341142 [Pecten maximus]|uniref:uncharacterized protein LOC117341142 n=1 Tax=Pecten maximus TaxID=6579 RepID=UPI0014586B9B|nr:uncharacterized protein LOC117341142 [Pecten maximus]